MIVEQLELPFNFSTRHEDWEIAVEDLLQIAHYVAQTSLMKHYKSSLLDKIIRSASDILSCESTRVHNNTQSMIQWCLLWTEDAQRIYWENKQSTHRKTCMMRDASGKRFWSVEHPHPIMEIKNSLIEGCSLQELRDWMHTYGRAVIVSQNELAALPQLGKDRYEKLGIRFGRFDPGTLTRTR